MLGFLANGIFNVLHEHTWVGNNGGFGANAATKFIAKTLESTLNSLMDAGKHYGSCDCYFIVITHHDSFGLM